MDTAKHMTAAPKKRCVHSIKHSINVSSAPHKIVPRARSANRTTNASSKRAAALSLMHSVKKAKVAKKKVSVHEEVTPVSPSTTATV
tara:strand:+ start:4417 stop:4677 length:261 start_codon:yes stop_codon:yes gene_type:complete